MIGLGLNTVFYMSTTSYAAQYVEDTLFIPSYKFGFLIKNQVFIGVWVSIRVFTSIPLIYLSIFVPIPSCFQDYSSVVELEVRDGDASRSSFIVQGCFGYPGSFVSPYKVENCSFKVCEELCWDFMGIALNL